MPSRPLLAALLALSAHSAAFADMATPGFSRVPRDLVLEVESDTPGYRFWLVSAKGVEPLDLAPGLPVRVDGEPRLGSHRIAWVVAAPVGLLEGMGEADTREAFHRWKLPPDVSQSEQVDFLGSVPFFDSRERVIDRYRVEFAPGQPVRLVFLGQNAGSPWVKAAWAAAGLFALAAVVWVGWMVVRAVRRASRTPA